MFTKDTRRWLWVWGAFVVVLFGAVVIMQWLSMKTDDNVRAEVAIRQSTDAIVQMQERDLILEMSKRMPVPETDDEARMFTLVAFTDALEAYQLSVGAYPVAFGEAEALIPLNPDQLPCKELLAGEYIEYCPRDPIWPNRSFRYRSVTGTSYQLTALLNDNTSPYCLLVAAGCVFTIETGAVRTGPVASPTFLPILDGLLPVAHLFAE